MAIQAITREEEAKLPRFRSHREAKMYFSIKYGDAFEINEGFAVGEGDNATICHRCNLILNREIYDRGMRELTQGSMADAGDFLASYQSIEIMLDGSVHVIH